MPTSKHRKRSKQNSFGLRKEKKRQDEERQRQINFENRRYQQAQEEAIVTEFNIRATSYLLHKGVK